MAATVVAGSATGVLAAPASAPTAKVAVSELLAPVLYGKATAAGSGTQSLRFSARTLGSSSWDLLNDVAADGREAYRQLPGGVLTIGERFEYQISHCDSSGCTSSDVKTGAVSPSLGAGSRPGATRTSFTIGDGTSAQVDVGSGNLMVSTNAFSLGRAVAAGLPIGVTYNSVTRRGDNHFDGSVGQASSGWRLSTGSDVRLRHVPGYGAVVYHGVNGLTGTFLPVPGTNTYTPPTGFKMDLSGDATNGWTLHDHGSGAKRHFDGAGRLLDIEDRNGNVLTFGYAADGTFTEIVTDKGPQAARRIAVTTAADGGPVTKLRQAPADGSGLEARAVNFGYDEQNRLTSVTDRLGRRTDFTYSGSGNLWRVIAPGGAATTFAYDAEGRVKSVSQPTATPGVEAMTRFSYQDGQTLVADPNTDPNQWFSTGVPRTTYALKDDGWLLVEKTTDPAGNERSATFTPFHDVESTTNSSGTTTFGYTANDGESLTGITSQTGAGSSYAYENSAPAQYQPSTSTDGQGNQSQHLYDEYGNSVSTTTQSSATASVERNPDGTVESSTSPSSAVTTYGYDGDKQLTSITPPTANSLAARAYTYDGFGRLATATNGRGITETFTYDKQDRVLEVDYSDSTPSVSYTYDPAGRTETRTDASGVTTYGYDPLGRLASRVHSAGGGVLTYEYDRVGNLVRETDANGTTTHTYDVRNLLTRTEMPNGQAIAFGYDGDGQRLDTWFGTNTGNTAWSAHTHKEFDGSNRLTRVWTARASNDATRVSDLSYGYASPGTDGCPTAPAAGKDTSLRWTQTDHVAGRTTTYCYDGANRLVSAITPGGDSWKYTYDGNGNRTQTTKNGAVVQTLAVNNADQLITAGYGYDGSGNLTGAPNSSTQLSYNGSQQMTGRTTSGGYSGLQSSYTYAGSDQRELLSQTLPNGSVWSYAYGRTDQNGLPLLESISNPSGQSYLVHDDGGSPLALKAHTGNYVYYVLDGLGSPVGLINASGALVSTYSYDPYGQVTENNLTGNSVTALNPYRFVGGMQDRMAPSYVKFGMRWYDAATGRFTQQDSIETLADPTRSNRYEYAAGNPVNSVDPTGLIDWSEVGSACAEGAVQGVVTGLFNGTSYSVAGAAANAVGGCAVDGAVEALDQYGQDSAGDVVEGLGYAYDAYEYVKWWL